MGSVVGNLAIPVADGAGAGGEQGCHWLVDCCASRKRREGVMNGNEIDS